MAAQLLFVKVKIKNWKLATTWVYEVKEILNVISLFTFLKNQAKRKLQ